MKTAVSAQWLVPFLLVIVVVVAVTTVVVNQITRPHSVVVRITDGPTVLSTQVVPLR